MPHAASHLRPHARLHAPDPAWRAWDQAWTRHLPTLTGRRDLSVVVAPGAGGGAPACCYPTEARIEVDAAHIGDPDVANPKRPGHKKLVPTAYGLLVHEAAHATHSHWNPPPLTPPVLADVALLLEESRVEYRQRGRRRGDRRWLRHTVTTLISSDDAPVDDPWHAGQVAGLLLARVDARILTAKDVRAARAAVTGVLGRTRLRQLRQVWQAAHQTGDTDAHTMIDLARRWCAILGIDPDRDPNTPVADPAAFPGRLAAAITDYLATAAGLPPTEYVHQSITARHAAPAAWTRRDPTEHERAAARRLATRLRHAHTRQPEPTVTSAQAPPGRLRARAAITADAQRATGAVPTANPWQRRTTQPPPRPTLRLAVLVDVSGSMAAYAEPMSSAGWILAHAARTTHAVTTTIAFGEKVTLFVPPRARPDQVLRMRALDATEEFWDAVKLADTLIGLRQRVGVRMLAVVSDGRFRDPDAAQRLITAIHQAGAAVLWLHPHPERGHVYRHTTTIAVTDPVTAIEHIAHAAVTALATA